MKKFKDGTTIAQIVEDGWSRGFSLDQVTGEVIDQQFEGIVDLLYITYLYNHYQEEYKSWESQCIEEKDDSEDFYSDLD